MKAAIVGGGGVRTPQLLKALLYHGSALGLEAVHIMDVDSQRLRGMGKVLRAINRSAQNPVPLTLTEDPVEALSDMDYVFFTIRVGGMESRILDEEVPLKHGVLGQETTGPGGFSMALRTIPVILDYMDVLRRQSPKAWALNLTNPAGIITQAVLDHGHDRFVGICDSPSELFADIAAAAQKDPDTLWFDYFGINHLGWIQRILDRGEDILPQLLANDEALLRHGTAMISPDFIRSLGVIPNEYLMFYYNTRDIVGKTLQSGVTRGVVIDALNKKLFEQLDRQPADREGEEKALRLFYQYSRARSMSYMQLETGGLDEGGEAVESLWERAFTDEYQEKSEPEGYSAIALAVIRGLHGNQPVTTTLNVRNHGVLPCLDAHDVVEIQTRIDASGVHPFQVPSPIPEHCRGLLQAVKCYERLTVEAIREKSPARALQALTVHPLVPDGTTAQVLLQDILAAHQSYLPPELTGSI